tara:strand:+ start:1303 stop:1647 length:345 start_codon:yes stop_codon:yes gene_type:complete
MSPLVAHAPTGAFSVHSSVDADLLPGALDAPEDKAEALVPVPELDDLVLDKLFVSVQDEPFQVSELAVAVDPSVNPPALIAKEEFPATAEEDLAVFKSVVSVQADPFQVSTTPE